MAEEKGRQRYTTIHIPVALAKLIDNLIDTGDFAYTSRAEFVKDAIRRALEKHGFYPGGSRSLLDMDLNNEKIQEELAKRINRLKELRSLLVAGESK